MTGHRSSIGPIALIDGIAMTISADRSGWRSTFTRGEELIAEDRCKTYPWLGRYAPGHLAGVLCKAAPLNRDAVKAAITGAFEIIKTSPDAGALISEAASRVIARTVSAKIELCDPPVYVVDLEGGSMIFTSKEIAAHAPIVINTRWLSVHPRDPLNANGADFQTAIDYWLSIAEEVEPAGNANPWEGIVEGLQIAIAPLPAHADKDGLLKSGLWQEEGGPLWIAGRVIAAVLKDSGRSETDSGFSKYLQSAGILVCPSKPVRVGRVLIRAWGFTPDFLPDDPGISEFAPLAGAGVRP